MYILAFYVVLPKRESQTHPFRCQYEIISDVVSLNSLLGTLNARGSLKASVTGTTALSIPILSQGLLLPRIKAPFVPRREERVRLICVIFRVVG